MQANKQGRVSSNWKVQCQHLHALTLTAQIAMSLQSYNPTLMTKSNMGQRKNHGSLHLCQHVQAMMVIVAMMVLQITCIVSWNTLLCNMQVMGFVDRVAANNFMTLNPNRVTAALHLDVTSPQAIGFTLQTNSTVRVGCNTAVSA